MSEDKSRCEVVELSLPGSSTFMELVITCNIAVRWKNVPAPMVVPVIRLMMSTSFLEERTVILAELSQYTGWPKETYS